MIYFSDAKSNNAHAPPAGGGGPSSYPPVSNSANYGAQQQMVSYARSYAQKCYAPALIVRLKFPMPFSKYTH